MKRGEGGSESSRVEIDMGEIEEIFRRASQGPLTSQDLEKLRGAMETLSWLQGEISRKDASLGRLRKLLFGTTSTEKTRQVLGDPAAESPAKGDDGDGDPPQRTVPDVEKPASKGHGRRGAADYPGATWIFVSHATLKAGDPCPAEGCEGKLYPATPRRLVCLYGHTPVTATVYEREALRCGLCGKVVVAGLPEGVHECKYDPTVASTIGELKYGAGMPFHRLETLQGHAGVPLPATTQWEIVQGAQRELLPVYEELVRQAAQGRVVHNDDTTMTILDHERENRGKEKGERTGTFTSGIVSEVQDHRVALFFTGRDHAGENLTKVMAERERQLPPPIQMCDGLDRNRPDEPFETLLANCLGHGRRNFVEVVESFPEACRYVLETLRDVYRNEAQARRTSMTPEERLRHHQEHSGPLMEKLRDWMAQQLEARRVEPNSGLGEAIRYMQKRWDRLNLFLKVPGAPLDNNLCERALKKAILHRKNALFYKTENGAKVGDVFMSLIHTAELNGINPFHYLTELLRHPREVRDHADRWLPWNYRDALAAARSP